MKWLDHFADPLKNGPISMPEKAAVHSLGQSEADCPLYLRRVCSRGLTRTRTAQQHTMKQDPLFGRPYGTFEEPSRRVTAGSANHDGLEEVSHQISCKSPPLTTLREG